MNFSQILLTHGFFPTLERDSKAPASLEEVGTVISNLASLGYAPNIELMRQLRVASSDALAKVWPDAQRALKVITGANRKMEKFVVYKNFPKEVLEKTAAEYWIAQIFMYIGAPNDWFTQEDAARPKLDERLTLKVLQPASDSAINDIYASLVNQPSSWTTDQSEQVKFLALNRPSQAYDLSDFGFKDNGIALIAHAMSALVRGGSVVMSDATDVLRLAVAMSGATLQEKFKLRAFSRPERRFLVNLLEHSKHLEDDFAARPEAFKLLLMRLHPGEFKASRVSSAYDRLYRGELTTFDAAVERLLSVGDEEALELLSSRPGQFVRRLRKCYSVYGVGALAAFDAVAEKLTVLQLLRLRGYFNALNATKVRSFQPKGAWNKLQLKNNDLSIANDDLTSLNESIDRALTAKLKVALPNGVDVDSSVDAIKLHSNGQELAPYGRGTKFQIPSDVQFIRTASFWQAKSPSGYGNIWFDNGWNFFDASWKDLGACCWTDVAFDGSRRHRYNQSFEDAAAVFSGDPTNSKDLQGKACQMIDLYPQKLRELGVRYAVWSILCYSNIPFAKADDSLGTLQWGTDATAGKLYEPARAQMVFPLTGNGLTKQLAIVDLADNTLMYLDTNLPSTVRSAASNGLTLEKYMPAVMARIDAIPSVGDLFRCAPKSTKGKALKVRFSDEGVKLEGQTAYIFKPVNTNNKFVPFDLTSLLG